MKSENGNIKDIFEAAKKGKPKTIETLLARPGTDADAKDAHGQSALLIAATHGHIKSVNVLLAYGADVNATNEQGVTPLMAASENGYIEVVEAILGTKNDANAKDAHGESALLIASANGHIEVVKALLAHEADVNATNKQGVTPLMAASANGHIEVVKAILNAKNQAVSIDAVTEKNNTALRSAIESGHTEIVKMLLNAGATIHPGYLDVASFKISWILISTQIERNVKSMGEKLKSLYRAFMTPAKNADGVEIELKDMSQNTPSEHLNKKESTRPPQNGMEQNRDEEATKTNQHSKGSR